MYIVIGANGFLGSYMLKTLSEKNDGSIIAAYNSNIERIGNDSVTWTKCDVANADDILALRKYAGDISDCTVFYFAACHNLDNVKRNPEFARNINITSLANFLSIFSGAKQLFFSSTDCVYGENTQEIKSFKESDTRMPVNEYGRQKFEAEELVRKYGFNVVRLPFMVGPSLLQHKKHFYDDIIKKARNGEKVTLADGLVRSALDYASVSDILYMLSKINEVPSTLNLCGDDGLTKYDVGLMIEKKYNLPHENIVKVSESSIQKFFFEKRASSTVMDNSLLKSILGVERIPLNI